MHTCVHTHTQIYLPIGISMYRCDYRIYVRLSNAYATSMFRMRLYTHISTLLFCSFSFCHFCLCFLLSYTFDDYFFSLLFCFIHSDKCIEYGEHLELLLFFFSIVAYLFHLLPVVCRPHPFYHFLFLFHIVLQMAHTEKTRKKKRKKKNLHGKVCHHPSGILVFFHRALLTPDNNNIIW